MDFKNKDVAKRFECLSEADVIKNTGSYSGPISEIDLQTAEYLLKIKDNSIKEKEKEKQIKPVTSAPPAEK